MRTGARVQTLAPCRVVGCEVDLTYPGRRVIITTATIVIGEGLRPSPRRDASADPSGAFRWSVPLIRQVFDNHKDLALAFPPALHLARCTPQRCTSWIAVRMSSLPPILAGPLFSAQLQAPSSSFSHLRKSHSRCPQYTPSIPLETRFLGAQRQRDNDPAVWRRQATEGCTQSAASDCDLLNLALSS
jgi:hypothetical protein